MRGYNIWRPIMLIMIALITNTLVSNLLILFGLPRQTSEDLGFIAMIIAALITYTRMTKKRRK
ncbi:hypothetical protein V3851_22230 [Paenibacillus sp. M1]|uniref:Uncharacterized protein n=1 Tax=Paenibacillus haidiansis TaxID=1574488 RepID=A0ABU7VXQ2_9BACL